MVALSVERSLDARAERSRGSTGTSSTSGEVATASHAQPSARTADHIANTNVSMVWLSGHASYASPVHSPQALLWRMHQFQFMYVLPCTVSCNGQSLMTFRNVGEYDYCIRCAWSAVRGPRVVTVTTICLLGSTAAMSVCRTFYAHRHSYCCRYYWLQLIFLMHIAIDSAHLFSKIN